MNRSLLVQRKLEAAQSFAERLLASPARDHIAKIIVFGSVAKGTARPDSDVDVIVIGFDDPATLESVVTDAAYETLLEQGEGVTPIVESVHELIEPHSYFVYRASRYGKELYTVTEAELKRREMLARLRLAQEYVEAAEDALAHGHVRLAADAAYNAAELCAKAMLLLKMDDIPGSHGGIERQFSELYIKNGPLPRELGRRIHAGLGIRSQARYDPSASVTADMARSVIALARDMMGYLDDILKEGSGGQEDRSRH